MRFRKRITPEMLAWVNDRICGKTEEKPDDDDKGQGGDSGITNIEGKYENKEEKSPEGTLIPDAACAPQGIRFPLDASLLDEARRNLEQIIDILYANGQKVTENKLRTYREETKHVYDSYSKKRKKKPKDHHNAVRQQLQYVRRDLGYLNAIMAEFPDCTAVLPRWLRERIAFIRELYDQQNTMYEGNTHQHDDRIVSLSQPYVRPVRRGKLKPDTEFGTKVETSVVNRYLRAEDLRWDAFNESTTFRESAEKYRKAYGHYPQRILADTIFRTRDNIHFCKEKGIHMNGPKPGKRPRMRNSTVSSCVMSGWSPVNVVRLNVNSVSQKTVFP